MNPPPSVIEGMFALVCFVALIFVSIGAFVGTFFFINYFAPIPTGTTVAFWLAVSVICGVLSFGLWYGIGRFMALILVFIGAFVGAFFFIDYFALVPTGETVAFWFAVSVSLGFGLWYGIMRNGSSAAVAIAAVFVSAPSVIAGDYVIVGLLQCLTGECL